MDNREAVREVGWIASEARRIVFEPGATRSELVEYFERKAALLEHIAGTKSPGQERTDTFAMAAKAREEAEHLRAGLEWPRHGQSLSADSL